MAARFLIEQDVIEQDNEVRKATLQEDLDYLSKKLQRRGIAIDDIIDRASRLKVAVPSWGVGTGGTRFARFAGKGEPRNVFEKLDDCSTINKLVRTTPAVSLHIPWDKPENASTLVDAAAEHGLEFDAM